MTRRKHSGYFTMYFNRDQTNKIKYLNNNGFLNLTIGILTLTFYI